MNNFARPGLGATELPPVNADDNGKVLGVSDGEWAKVAASGGSDLPDDPAQDGTYNLQNTVSSGTGTLSWASGGSGGGVLVVHDTVSGGTHTLDKTWQEIKDADLAVIKRGTGTWIVHKIFDAFGHDISCFTSNAGSVSTLTYSATSADGYPSYEEIPS